MCPIPQSVDTLLPIKCVTEMKEKVDTSIPVDPVASEPIKVRQSASVSTSSSCTLDSGAELSALDEILTERLGGAMEALARNGDFQKDASNELGSCFEGPSGRAPSISIRAYVKRMLRYIDSGCGSSDWTLLSPGTRAFLTALVYIDRLTSKTGIIVNSSRIHRLVASAMLVALKSNEDAIVDMRFFSELAGVSFKEMKKMESSFIQLVEWDLVVSEQEFAARTRTWKRLTSLPKKC
jgi:hypothetical protein